MMKNKLDILRNLSIGSWIAEEEKEQLRRYFIGTEVYNSIINDKYDIVYGAAGSGKTALYLSIVDALQSNKLKKSCVVGITTPTSEAAFRLFADKLDDVTENVVRNTWGLTFAASCVKVMLENGIRDTVVLDLALKLTRLGVLNAPLMTPGDIIRNIISYLRNLNIIFDPEGGAFFIGAPGLMKRKGDQLSIADMFAKLNSVLVENHTDIWLLVDRLDVCFPARTPAETKGVRAFFHAYRDIKDAAPNVRIKIFLRTDVWKYITSGRDVFREARHINSRATYISWNRDSILSLIRQRFISNQHINDYVAKCEHIDINCRIEELFYTIFPKYIQDTLSTFDWMLSVTTDGTGEPSPREILHLLTETIRLQILRCERGEAKLPGDMLIEEEALVDAHRIVSQARLEQTIYAEHPDKREWIEKLRRTKNVQHNITTLAEIWEVREDIARNRVNQLVEIGFLKCDDENDPIRPYSVPALYSAALEMRQS